MNNRGWVVVKYMSSVGGDGDLKTCYMVLHQPSFGVDFRKEDIVGENLTVKEARIIYRLLNNGE